MKKFLDGRSQMPAISLVVLAGLIASADVGVKATAQSAEATATTVRSFVYTITNPEGPNAIAAYERNRETGELIFLGAYATGGRGTGRLVDSQSPLVATADGTLLYAINPGSDDISVMATNENGSLDPV